MSVDVTVCTYNSERHLAACLDSVVRHVPVHTLWVVDNHSTDDTPQIAQQFGGHVVPFRGSLAAARQHSFRLAQTERLVNVDSDVVLCPDWYAQVMRYWTRDAGCVWGSAVDQHPLQRAYAEAMWRLRDIRQYHIPHLSNMVARTDVLRDIQFPPEIMAGSTANEDWAVQRWITQQGLRCITAPVRVQHFSHPPLIDCKTYWYGASARRSHLASLPSILLRLGLSVPQAVYAGLASRNARVIPYWIRFRLQVLDGYLHSARYYDLKR